jgi:hypothetical protein
VGVRRQAWFQVKKIPAASDPSDWSEPGALETAPEGFYPTAEVPLFYMSKQGGDEATMGFYEKNPEHMFFQCSTGEEHGGDCFFINIYERTAFDHRWKAAPYVAQDDYWVDGMVIIQPSNLSFRQVSMREAMEDGFVGDFDKSQGFS